MAGTEPWITLRRGYEDSLKVLNDPSREVYVALEDHEVTGFLILNMNGAFVGYVQTICVAPNWRSKGLGSTLLKFAEERIFRESPNVFMCVSSFNTGAQRLYDRLGYERIGELKDYIVPGHSEILLRKTTGPLREFKKVETPDVVPRNKSIVRRYYEDLWNKWDLSRIEDLIAEDILFRGSLGVSVTGREGFKDYVHMVRDAFPDFHNTIEELIAEDERIAARLTYTGTHKGELFGMAATGKQVSYSGAAIFRIVRDHIVEGWVLGDTRGLVNQLRGSPPGGLMTGAASDQSRRDC